MQGSQSGVGGRDNARGRGRGRGRGQQRNVCGHHRNFRGGSNHKNDFTRGETSTGLEREEWGRDGNTPRNGNNQNRKRGNRSNNSTDTRRQLSERSKRLFSQDREDDINEDDDSENWESELRHQHPKNN